MHVCSSVVVDYILLYGFDDIVEVEDGSHSHNVTADQIILCFLINVFIYRNYYYKVALGVIVYYGRVFEV
jgi:hypothetical protein